MNNPSALLLLLPLLVVVFYTTWFWSRRKSSVKYTSLQILSKVPKSLHALMDPLPFILKVLALILIVLALTRPQKISEMSEKNVKGIDIMMVLDISLSMLVQDMGEGHTRLASAKKVVAEFIQGRVSDKIGLILFSGESYTSVPLTLDYQVLLQKLSQVRATSSIKSGTAIGLALANATARLRHTQRNPVIVFLTDGENNAGSIDPLTALKLVKSQKIRVYTIGLGRINGRAPIRYEHTSPSGRIQNQVLYVNTRINKKLMKQMAVSTGGRFFQAKDVQNLARIFSEINKLEKQEIVVNKWTEYKELFTLPLSWALAFYSLSILLGLLVFFRGF